MSVANQLPFGREVEDVEPIGRFAGIKNTLATSYFGSTRSFGSVGVTRAPAAVAAFSLVALVSARGWPGLLPLISQKTPIAAAKSTAALAKAKCLEVLTLSIRTPCIPIADREGLFQPRLLIWQGRPVDGRARNPPVPRKGDRFLRRSRLVLLASNFFAIA